MSTDNATLNRLVKFAEQQQEQIYLAIESKNETLKLQATLQLRRTFNEITQGFYPLSLID